MKHGYLDFRIIDIFRTLQRHHQDFINVIWGGGATMTMQPLDFANGHSQNDHFDNDHKIFGITKWSWSNGQNYQNKIIKFKFHNFNSN